MNFKKAVVEKLRLFYVLFFKKRFMEKILKSKVIQVFIHRDYQTVCDFIEQPQNFHLWASGMGKLKDKIGDTWIADGPEGQGEVKIKFTPRNEYGVADHVVYMPDGKEVYIPLRVIKSGEGSEVHFTLFHPPDMSEEDFAKDITWVAKDLKALKDVLEAKVTGAVLNPAE